MIRYFFLPDKSFLLLEFLDIHISIKYIIVHSNGFVKLCDTNKFINMDIIIIILNKLSFVSFQKYIVNIQKICLYNTNTIITSMTIKNVIKLVIKLVMKLKVRRGYEFEVKQKVQGYIV